MLRHCCQLKVEGRSLFRKGVSDLFNLVLAIPSCLIVPLEDSKTLATNACQQMDTIGYHWKTNRRSPSIRRCYTVYRERSLNGLDLWKMGSFRSGSSINWLIV